MSKRVWKSICAMGIAISMVMPMAEPLTVVAEEAAQISENVVASGVCGDNLEWSLNTENVLTISGEGDMYDWDVGDAPWTSSGYYSIQEVIIGDGVTSVGSYAFYEKTNVTKITIGEKVTQINENAFAYIGIRELVIPNSVEVIDDWAFAGGYLEHVFFGKGIKRIGYGAFSGQPLKTVEIYEGTIEDIQIEEENGILNEIKGEGGIDEDEDDEELENALKETYILEHIEFSESQEYYEKILHTFDSPLRFVMGDVETDIYLKGYNLLDQVNAALAGEVTLEGDEELYELILGSILKENQANIGEVYQANYTNEIIDLCEKISQVSEMNQSVYEEIGKVLKRMKESKSSLDEFIELVDQFFEYANTMSKDQLLKCIEKVCSSDFDALNIGIDYVEMIFSTIEGVVQYLANANAYLNTSSYFKDVLLQTAQYATDNPDLYYAINKFVDELEEYKVDSANKVAEYAYNEFIDQGGEFVLNTLSRTAMTGVDKIISQIPVLKNYVYLKWLLSAGQIFIDLSTEMEQRKYFGELLEKHHDMIEPLFCAIEAYKSELDAEDFESAVRFDYAIGLYKTLVKVSAKCGAEYEKGVLKDTIMNTIPGESYLEKTRASWCSTAIHLMSYEELEYNNLQCHSENLIYDHKTDSITYKSDDLMCYTVGCPVNVIVETDAGEKIAELSGENSYIKQGYEKYFFVVENGGEDIKIAVVPSNYKVTLKGTDIGTMDVVTNNIMSGNVENPKGFYNIPVTSTTEGYFDQSTDTLVVDNKIYTEDTVDHQHSYDSPKFDWSEDLSMCTAQFRCNACHFTQKLECTVENLLDVMDANTQIARHVRKAKVEVDGRIYEDVKTKVIYPSGETTIQSDGWVSVGDNNWKYIYMGQEVVSNWISITEADPYNNNEVGEVWYHFGADGLMQRGWIVDETGWKIYLLDSNGRMMHSQWVNAPKNTELNRPAGIYHLTDDGAVQMNGWALAKNSQTVYWYCNPGTGLFEKNNPGSWSGKKLW